MAKRPDILQRFGKRVRQLRLEAGFSQEVFARLNVAKYIAAENSGGVQFIMFAPTGPLGRGSAGETLSNGENNVVSITDRFALGLGLGGGRLFGFGARTRGARGKFEEGYEQWFRIDWYDDRPDAAQRGVNVHYHILNDKHPPGRVIWRPRMNSDLDQRLMTDTFGSVRSGVSGFYNLVVRWTPEALAAILCNIGEPVGVWGMSPPFGEDGTPLPWGASLL